MSNPDFVMRQPQSGNPPMSEIPPGNFQMTPELLQAIQQYQDMQKRQAMAQSLMQNQANPTTANAGIANAGGDILGAALQKNMQNRADPENAVLQQRYGIGQGAANGITHPGMLSRLFSMGGG